MEYQLWGFGQNCPRYKAPHLHSTCALHCPLGITDSFVIVGYHIICKFVIKHLTRIWMWTNWKFHRIWNVIEVSLLKWDLCSLQHRKLTQLTRIIPDLVPKHLMCIGRIQTNFKFVYWRFTNILYWQATPLINVLIICCSQGISTGFHLSIVFNSLGPRKLCRQEFR